MKISRKLARYFKDYKFNSLLFKNLLLLLLLIMVPLTGATLISYYAYNNLQEKEIHDLSEQTVSDVYSDMERILKEAQTELTYFGLSSDVDLFLYDDEIRQHNYRISTIQGLLRMPMIVKDYVDSVYIYSMSSSRIVGLAGVADFETFAGKEAIETFLDQKDGKSLFVREDNYGGYPKKYLTMFQMIGYENQQRGVSMMNLDLEGVLKELSVLDNVEVYLTNGTEILLSTEENLQGRECEAIPGYDRIVHGGTRSDKEFAVSSKVAENSGMEVITRMNLQGYHNQLGTIQRVLLLLLLVMALITLGLSVMISVRLFRPIDRIVSFFQEYSDTLMEEKELFTGKDELEYILNSIEQTVDVKKNVEEELAVRVRLLKKAQAVALQSQINPHFLNNTLETINWTALELLGGRNEISEMTGSLSKMLRMSLENSDTIVSISTEVEHCSYYLDIQQKRYEDKFNVVWKIPSEIREYKVIRVVLQPLVENAIYHGIKRLSNKGLIVISGSLTEDGKDVVLTVADNGLGMTKAELARLRESMKSDIIKESKHIGVTNVNQRLRLYFGDEYGLEVDSQEDKGTVVTMRFPKTL